MFALNIHAMSLVDVVVLVIVVAAIIGILYVALRAFGVSIPPWVAQFFLGLAIYLFWRSEKRGDRLEVQLRREREFWDGDESCHFR